MKYSQQYVSTSLFVLLIAIIILGTFISFARIKQFSKANEAINQSILTKNYLNQALSYLKDAETGQRGFLLTNDSVFLEPYIGADVKIRRLLIKLDSITSHNPSQQAQLKTLSTLIEERIMLLNAVLTRYNHFQPNPQLLIEGKNKMNEVRGQSEIIFKTEDDILQYNTEVKNNSASLTPFFLVLLFLVSIIAITFFFFSSRNEKKLRISLQEKSEIQESINKKVKENEYLFKLALKGSAHIVFAQDKNLKHTWIFNPLIGFNTEDIIGKDDTEIHEPETAQRLTRLKAKAIQQGKSIQEEVLIKLKGEPYYFDVLIDPIKNEVGEVTGLTGVAINITEKVKARIKIEESERKLLEMAASLEEKIKERTTELTNRNIFVETLINSTIDVITVFDREYRFLKVNKKAEELYKKIYPDNVIGEKLEDVSRNVHQTTAYADIGTAFNGEVVSHRQFKSSFEDKYFDIDFIPIKNEKEIYAVMAISRDVTENVLALQEISKAKRRLEMVNRELRLQNQTFEHAENVAKLGSYKWNFTTGEMHYSDNLFRLFDCEPQEFVPTFEKFLSFIHPDDLQQVIHNGEETVQSGKLVETPYRIISKKGQIKHLRSSGSFIGEEDNRILIGTVQDISKDIIAAEELRTKNLALEATNTELASFSYIASHDLKEPLRKIQAFSKRILEIETFTDKTLDYFIRIIASSERMEKLIESLMDFSKTNAAELVFEAIDLNKIVEEAKAYISESIREANAVIQSENLPIVNVVPIQFSQLITNLLDNAIKYRRQGVKPEIKITSSLVYGKDISHLLANHHIYYHQINISDNGIGFDPQYANKIFVLFQRLHHKNEYSGTGIGLAICKKIINNHNGFIIAEGIPEVGATFRIYIPA